MELRKPEKLATNELHSLLPAIGRFLIVVTFIEDSLRIVTQWSDQLLYLHDYRGSKRSSPFFPLFPCPFY